MNGQFGVCVQQKFVSEVSSKLNTRVVTDICLSCLLAVRCISVLAVTNFFAAGVC